MNRHKRPAKGQCSTGCSNFDAIRGLPGPTGATGPTGPPGATGATGATGAGIPGLPGAPGAPGATGAPGPTGAAGSNGPSARLFREGPTPVGDGESVPIVFTGVRFDNAGFFDPAFPTRLTAPVSGRYQITGQVSFDEPEVTTGSRVMTFVANSNDFIFVEREPATTLEGETTINGTTLWHLNAGEYVELVVGAFGEASTVQSSPVYTPEFMMVLVDSTPPFGV